MKSIKTCLLIAALCCILPVSAQKTFGAARYTAMCSYYGENISGDISAYEADGTAEAVVTKIMSVLGLKANFELRAANVPNAAAVILKSKRYILYNPNFMNSINKATGSNWAAISIFAHEIGHHLNGHTLDNVGSRPMTELEADEFSGFVLARMGASLEDAQAVMSVIASIKGSHSHPAKKDRLSYIAAGWKKAGGIQQISIAATVPKSASRAAQPAKVAAPQLEVVTAVAQRQQPEPEKTRNYIASDAYFVTNPKGKYYLTSKGNLVLEQTNGYYVIGSLSQSDRSGYKLMFAGNNNNIYIAQGGTLISDTGKRIGYLKTRE